MKALKLNKSPGITLLELIIALALILCIATTMFYYGSIAKRLFVRAEIEKLYALSLYVQRRAQIENVEHALFFDDSNQSYRAVGQSEKLADGVIFGFYAGVQGPPSQPTALIKKPITFVDKKIIFYPDGTISSGTVYITDEARSCLYALTSGIAQVAHLRRYRYESEKWHFIE